MPAAVGLSVGDDVLAAGVPDEAFFARCASRAIHAAPPDAGRPADAVQHELSVRVVAGPEGAELNQRYRGKPSATNVLSFPAGLPPLDGILTLGDLVFCAEVVQREASEQGKLLESHWAHLIVHGTLHLLGHDHEHEAEARAMEALEIQLLSGLGIADPYRGTDEPG